MYQALPGAPGSGLATAMDMVLWVAQVLLAAAFIAAGFLHAFRFDQFATMPRMEWAGAVGRRNMRVIGLLELAGAVGVTVPAAVDIMPWLTPVAAAGLAMTMVPAAILHLRRREPVFANAGLFAVAAFVVIGRTIAESL